MKKQVGHEEKERTVKEGRKKRKIKARFQKEKYSKQSQRQLPVQRGGKECSEYKGSGQVRKGPRINLKEIL